MPKKRRAYHNVRSPISGGAEHFVELVRLGDLELVVAALRGRFVGAPAQEHGGMPESIALQVVVFHLADAFDPERFPRQILTRAPAALTAGHPSHLVTLRGGPLAPRVMR